MIRRKIPQRKKTRDEREARRIVAERSSVDGYRTCEVAVPSTVHGLSGVCTGAATDFSHRKSRGVGGKWSPANGLDSCRACHRWITEHPTVAYKHGWFVRGHEDPQKIPVFYRGLEWIELSDDEDTLPG